MKRLRCSIEKLCWLSDCDPHRTPTSKIQTWEKTKLLCDVRWNASALSVIFVPMQYIELLIVNSGIFYSLSILSPAQHSGSNRLKKNLGCLFFLSCVTLPASSCYLIFISHLPSHIATIHTFCLHSCLSLIGWQVCGRRCWLIYWVLQVLVVHVRLASSWKDI